jgi:hypothetical protein
MKINPIYFRLASRSGYVLSLAFSCLVLVPSCGESTLCDQALTRMRICGHARVSSGAMASSRCTAELAAEAEIVLNQSCSSLAASKSDGWLERWLDSVMPDPDYPADETGKKGEVGDACLHSGECGQGLVCFGPPEPDPSNLGVCDEPGGLGLNCTSEDQCAGDELRCNYKTWECELVP